LSLFDQAALEDIARKYFEALYQGNADLFAAIFHPEARLFCFADPVPVIIGLDEYLAIVRGRASPASRKDPREDEVLSIEIPTPTTAHLRVREIFRPKRFTDELTLAKTADGWRIVSKVWHFTLDAATAV
jgi:hypothetical protein